MMKKRKNVVHDPSQTIQHGDRDSPLLQHQGTVKASAVGLKGNLATSPGRSTLTKVDVCGTVKGKIPAARDGHSATIFNDMMIVFGGDRHRMPFSDTFSLQVKNQLVGKNLN
jgi:hypothetical protein